MPPLERWIGRQPQNAASHYSRDNYHIEFDPTTGVYSRIKLSAPRKDCAGYSGMAQLLRSLGKGQVLVAQYLSSGDPWLSIGAERWKLFDESISVKHKEAWGVFLCELSLHKDGKCIRMLRYWRRDWFAAIIGVATYDQLDFSLANLPVDFEPHGLSSLQEQREDFIKLWSAGERSGTPVPDGANMAFERDAPRAARPST